MRRGGGDPEIHRGREGLATVIGMLTGFEATLHEVSGLVVEFEPGGGAAVDESEADARAGRTSLCRARGECVCVAHHITRVDGREADDLTLHGRYSDRFVRRPSGVWCFAARELRVLWTEKRRVRLPQPRRTTSRLVDRKPSR